MSLILLGGFMFYKISISFIFIAGLAGCQSAVKPDKTWLNKLDPDTPTAKVNFLVDKSGAEGTYFHINYDSACVVELNQDFYFGVVSVPYSDNYRSYKEKIQTVNIPANRLMSIVLSSSTSHATGYRSTLVTSCEFALEWEPKKGREYSVFYSWEYGGCKIGMKEFGKNGYKEVEDLQIFQHNLGNCKPID